MIRKTLAIAFTVLVGLAGVAFSVEHTDIAEPVIRLAKPELRDRLYGSNVLVVMPLGGPVAVWRPGELRAKVDASAWYVPVPLRRSQQADKRNKPG